LSPEVEGRLNAPLTWTWPRVYLNNLSAQHQYRNC
jgi:hypothetical protein